MRYIGVEDDEAVFVDERGKEARVAVADFSHPELPNGDEDPHELLSPPIGEAGLVVTIPLTGDAAAQHLHLTKHPDDGERLAGLVKGAAVRELGEDAPDELIDALYPWRLGDRGKPDNPIDRLPDAPPAEEPPLRPHLPPGVFQ